MHRALVSLFLLIILAGCSSPESDPKGEPVDFEKLKEQKVLLDSAIVPELESLSGNGEPPLMPIREIISEEDAQQLTFHRTHFEQGVTAWIAATESWALPAAAQEGVPSGEDFAAFNSALLSHDELQAAWTNTILEHCVGMVYLDCINAHPNPHSAWDQSVTDLSEAEKRFNEASSASRP